MKETFTGSCLCGSVSYRISGDAERFYHCHCQRCRKATGSGHASNILMSNPDSVEWLTGTDQIAHYQVVDAKRFASVFCKTCGSMLPRIAPDNSMAVIPAGSLDMQPAIRPQARIFWDSRADWSCADEAIPTFSRYPE